jgi:nucleoside-diphosphate-sugar epimerase
MPELGGKTVLVTGGGGFIGARVVRTLAAGGAAVRALLGPPGFAAAAPPAGVATAFAEVGDLAALTGLAAGADVVVHLAGPPGVAASFDDPVRYARVHVEGTVTVLEACRRAGVGRLVHVSSAEVYGRPSSNPVAESHPVRPRSPYGAAKAGAEHFVGAFARSFGLAAVILRPFSVYGPGLARHSLLGTLLQQVRQGDALTVADPRPVRDYCYVDDVAEAVARACTVPAPEPAVFNVGSGTGTSVADLAALLLDVAGRRLPLRTDPGRGRPGAADLLHLVADVGRARQGLGWVAATPLPRGLRQTLDWMEASCPSAS